MAAVVGPPFGAATDKNAGKQQGNGPPTPDPTPGPEDARLAADVARRVAEEQARREAEAKDKGSDATSPPSSQEGVPQEHIGAVESVMKCSETDARQILGIQDENPNIDDVIMAYKKVGCLTHEKCNKANNASEAFRRVNEAAKNLGVNETAIEQMRNWDGVLDLNLSENPTGEDKDMGDAPPIDHVRLYELCGDVLSIILEKPYDENEIGALHQANEKIRELNAECGYSSTAFIIDVDRFVQTFRRAFPDRETLKKIPDPLARERLESANESLREYNLEHGYPSNWLISIPSPPAQTTRPPAQKPPSQTRSEELPKPLAFDEQDGYVLQGGVEKKLSGYIKAGWGHRVLLRQYGKNGYDIFEFVRASKFGKSFVERNQHVLSGTEIKAGTKASLRGLSWGKVYIYGVAPVRTDSNDDEVRSMAWVGFPGKKEPAWYWRSHLGEEFGVDAVDEKLNAFRRKAGQLPKAVRVEDEAEVSDYDEEEEEEEEEEDPETTLQKLREEVKRLEQKARSRGSSGATRKPKLRRRAK